jgi:hypothetical protein
MKNLLAYSGMLYLLKCKLQNEIIIWQRPGELFCYSTMVADWQIQILAGICGICSRSVAVV